MGHPRPHGRACRARRAAGRAAAPRSAASLAEGRQVIGLAAGRHASPSAPSALARASAGERTRKLRLVHRGAAFDAAAARLGVELGVGRATGPAVRAQPAAPGRRNVLRRCPAGGPRLPGAGALLVHRARGDLLGPTGALPALFCALLDVLVLPLSLRARSPGHPRHLPPAADPAPAPFSAAPPTRMNAVHARPPAGCPLAIRSAAPRPASGPRDRPRLPAEMSETPTCGNERDVRDRPAGGR